MCTAFESLSIFNTKNLYYRECDFFGVYIDVLLFVFPGGKTKLQPHYKSFT